MSAKVARLENLLIHGSAEDDGELVVPHRQHLADILPFRVRRLQQDVLAFHDRVGDAARQRRNVARIVRLGLAGGEHPGLAADAHAQERLVHRSAERREIVEDRTVTERAAGFDVERTGVHRADRRTADRAEIASVNHAGHGAEKPSAGNWLHLAVGKPAGKSRRD